MADEVSFIEELGALDAQFEFPEIEEEDTKTAVPKAEVEPPISPLVKDMFQTEEETEEVQPKKPKDKKVEPKKQETITDENEEVVDETQETSESDTPVP